MNRRGYKGWPVWAAIGLVVVVALAVGVGRTGGARSPQQRIDAIAKTLKCPPCEGESVYESRNSVAINIKNEIAREVRAGQTDDEIRAGVAERFGEDVLLVPSATGVDSLVWILPVVVFIAAAAGLSAAFVRWRHDVAEAGEPTAADRALVADALREEAWP
jgi:cytochrome c-type biogenesis protein CcmH/NrfF